MGYRLRPIRTIALAAAVGMVALALTGLARFADQRGDDGHRIGDHVSDNGLAFTAIAEIAGRFGADVHWAHRTPASLADRCLARRCSALDRSCGLSGGVRGLCALFRSSRYRRARRFRPGTAAVRLRSSARRNPESSLGIVDSGGRVV